MAEPPGTLTTAATGGIAGKDFKKVRQAGRVFRAAPSLVGGGLGLGIGAASGILSYILSNKKKKDKSFWGRALLGAALGAGAGGGLGYAYGELADISRLDPVSKKLLSGKGKLSKEDWGRLYSENVKDPKAREYLAANPDDPRHPANVLYRRLQAHADKPEIGFPGSVPLSRSRLALARRPEGASYVGQEGDSGITRQDLKDMGFQPSMIAVPERGQSEWLTWRHPKHNVHIHRHPKSWMLHVDSFPSTQMLRYNLDKAGLDYSARNVLAAILHGAPHAIIEGVPGWLGAGAARLLDMPTFTQLIETKTGERPHLPGIDYYRPGVMAARVGGAVGLPLLGYYGYKYITKPDEEEKKKKRRRRPRRRKSPVRRKPRVAIA